MLSYVVNMYFQFLWCICFTDSENRTKDGFYIKYMRLLVVCFCTYLPKFKLLQQSNESDVGVIISAAHMVDLYLTL
jgi:hypothetical protein